jgi:hypothetical protein
MGRARPIRKHAYDCDLLRSSGAYGAQYSKGNKVQQRAALPYCRRDALVSREIESVY